MPQINVLDKQTIDKIAAGEVVEKPASVVKELVENAIDAGADAITVEVKQGGIAFIRVTDNGCGIDKEQLRLAFTRHATSKIVSVEDLETISSLGFRGEALSSISAVAQVEMITKQPEHLTGFRYQINGGEELSLEEVGAPDGTTIIVRNIFFNTPARAKFLRTATTEGNYISGYMEQLALSHPAISFKYILNGQVRFQTSGNGNLREIIYQIYGRDISRELIEIASVCEAVTIHGFIGKPIISRGNRNFENYYVNGRYVKDKIIMKAIEESYRTFLMQHQYPFTCLFIDVKGDQVDVNVHPAKMEVRFSSQQEIFQEIRDVIFEALHQATLVPKIELEEQKKKTEEKKPAMPEPFEANRKARYLREMGSYGKAESGKPFAKDDRQPSKNIPCRTLDPGPVNPVRITGNTSQNVPARETKGILPSAMPEEKGTVTNSRTSAMPEEKGTVTNSRSSAMTEEKGTVTNSRSSAAPAEASKEITDARQMSLFDEESPFTSENRRRYQIIGQVFDTYWIIQLENEMYIIDQHAAHEKVLYERFMKEHEKREIISQMISPPVVLNPSREEMEILKEYREVFQEFGFELEDFGQDAVCIRSVPHNLYGLSEKSIFMELLSECADVLDKKDNRRMIGERIATMACKAAVKGNNRLSLPEVNELLDELLTLDNPFQCPHGRPTIIRMSKTELEKKFRRIV